MQERDFQITSSAGRPLWISAHAQDFEQSRPGVVLCHGFCGFKDWGWFPYLATRFAEAGVNAFRINFSHNGIGADPVNFTELAAFEANTFGKMLADLDAVLKTVTQLPWVDQDDLSLLGHSVGGGVVTLFAAQHPERVAKVVGWNPIADCNRFGPDALAMLKEQGRIPYRNGRTGQTFHTGSDFFRDLQEHPEEREICDAAAKLGARLAVVQGASDTTVLPETSSRVANASNSATLCSIAGGDHVFNCGHPFNGPSPELEEAIRASIAFIAHART